MRILLVAFLSSLLVACGGSGSSSPDTGTLTLAITDNSIHDWDQAVMQLNAVTLIGQGGQETEMLDPRPQRVDLLQLRNVSEFLAQQTLTARSISKIRLNIAGLTLNKVDPMTGLVTETASPPMPSRRWPKWPRSVAGRS